MTHRIAAALRASSWGKFCKSHPGSFLLSVPSSSPLPHPLPHFPAVLTPFVTAGQSSSLSLEWSLGLAFPLLHHVATSHPPYYNDGLFPFVFLIFGAESGASRMHIAHEVNAPPLNLSSALEFQVEEGV